MEKKGRRTFHISGRVIDSTTRRGIEGLRVETWDRSGKYSDYISKAITDKKGAFKMEIEEARLHEIFGDEPQDLFFKVFRGEELIKSTEKQKLWYLMWNTGFENTRIVMEVNKNELPEPRLNFNNLSLSDLLSDSPSTARASLAKRLEKLKIDSPKALIETGAARVIEMGKLGKAHAAAVGELEINAKLGLLGVSRSARRILIEHGFSSPTDIAAASAARFKETLGPLLGDEEATNIHSTASIQSAFLNNLSTAARIGKQSVTASKISDPSLFSLPTDATVDCGCQDCEAATSPLAYLADLLTYTDGRLIWMAYDSIFQHEYASFIPGLPETLLYQPFGDLRMACNTVEEEVSRIRLDIESILNLINKNLAGQPDVACSPLSHSISFAFAADVNGDRQYELIIAFDRDESSILAPQEEVGTGFWIMHYNKNKGRWQHLAPGNDPTAAAFFLPHGMKAKFGFAGTFQADTTNVRRDRQQIVLAVEYSGMSGQEFWVLQFDQANMRWNHISPAVAGPGIEVGGIFGTSGGDIAIPYNDISVKGAFAADVDGDHLDELIAFGSAPGQANPFWVFKQQGIAWGSLAPAGDPRNVAFVCSTAQYGIKLATAGDVNLDGRSEIIAIPDAPGNAGRDPWIMKYDPGTGLWAHLNPNSAQMLFDVDTALHGYPWPTEHVLVGSITGMNSAELIIASEYIIGQPTSDPNQFTVYAYNPHPRDIIELFNNLGSVDCSPSLEAKVRITLAADIDGDARDELIVFMRDFITTKADYRDAAWVMDRTNMGVWQHLSPIAGHPQGADLEWTPGGYYPAQSAFAADVDGDGQEEIIIIGDTSTRIWVLKYRSSDQSWEHLRNIPINTAGQRYEASAYQMLLSQLGTSYEELRLARTANDKTRRDLADRLSISLGIRQGSAGDRLDQLLKNPATVTQYELEELFELMATTRDPLSNVLVSGDTQKQTRRWYLEGVSWSADPATATTDENGKIHVTIQRLSRSSGPVTITLFRDAARNFTVATGEGTVSGTVRLSSLNGSGLSGWVDLAYKADTTTIELTALPQFACWQWQHLRELWDEEDEISDPFTATSTSDTIPTLLPIIDPDVIGPDNFRVPLPTGQPGGAFDIWLERRKWIDGLLQNFVTLQSNLDNMLDSLRPPAGASTPTDYPWHAAPPLDDLPRLLDQLSSGNTTEVEQAHKTIKDKLYLSVDAFVRLMTLRARYKIGTEPLMDSDWAEIRSILVQAYKASRFGAWRNEERTANITLDGNTFVPALTTPTEGIWPPDHPQGIPFIDPDLVAIKDLPTSLSGIKAIDLWRIRSLDLKNNLEVVRTARSRGFEQLLISGLGSAPIISTTSTWTDWIRAQARELKSTDPARIAQAETTIQTIMQGITVSMFRRIAAIESKLSNSTPTEVEWTDIETIMATARKHRVLYLQWANKENGANPLPYWKARRALLPRWRASPEIRIIWEQALQNRCRLPVVDPDRLHPTWLRHPASRAHELYYGRFVAGSKPGRLSELKFRESALRGRIAGATTPLAGLDVALVDALAPGDEHSRILTEITACRQADGFERVLGQVFANKVDELDNLLLDINAGGTRASDAQKRIFEEHCFSELSTFHSVMNARQNPSTVGVAQWQVIDNVLANISIIRWLIHADRRVVEAGVKLTTALAQMGFTSSAWQRLRSIRNLASQIGLLLLDEEIDEVMAILMRADKIRRYARWRDEERGDGQQVPVRLSPDSFAEPSPQTDEDSPWEPPAWRVVSSELRWWQNTLETRANQHNQILAGLRDSVVRVEESTLPALRDQLIAQLPVVGTDAGARWVADHLLIDPKAEGCQRTTRVAYAIDSLLALIWSIRTGQLADTYPKLRLDDRTFEQDWQWIGSYSTWRSAILVHLYPENLLHPSLRQDQSPGFRSATEELRSAQMLTPSRARRIAGNYAEYFRDVCYLDNEHMVCTDSIKTVFDPTLLVGSSGKPSLCQHRFAISSISNRIYWSLAESRKSGVEQGFWKHLEQFKDEIVTLVGATVYHAHGSNMVYLFGQIQNEDKQSLVCSRYDLDAGKWDSDVIPLEAPSGIKEFTAWILQVPSHQPPRLAFEFFIDKGGIRQRSRVSRSMNSKGTGWGNEFTILIEAEWKSVGSIAAAHTGARQILAGDFDGDGRDELAFIYDTEQPPAFFHFNGTSWIPMPNLGLPIPPDAFVVIGRFAPTGPNDMADQLVYVSLQAGSKKICRYHFLPSSNSWTAYNMIPSFLNSNTKVAISGDFDGDGVSELALNLDYGRAPTFHILKVDLTQPAGLPFIPALLLHDPQSPDYRIGNLADIASQVSFRCIDSGVFAPVGFAVSGDFDGDGRDELAIALASRMNSISTGNDFWVMDLRHASGGWSPLGEVGSTKYKVVYDFFGENVFLLGAVCGDFDGDGRDELAVIPYVETPNRGTRIPIADFVPDPRDPDPAVNGVWGSLPDIDLTSESVPIMSATTGDFDGDGFDEIALFGNGKIWIRKYNLNSNSWIEMPSNLLSTGIGPASAISSNFVGSAPATLRKPKRGARGRGTPDQVAIVPGTITHSSGNIPLQFPSTPDTIEVWHRAKWTPDANQPVSVFSFKGPTIPVPCRHDNIIPLYRGSWILDDTADRSKRREQTETAIQDNTNKPASVQAYIWEAFYGLPLQIALSLHRARSYDSALDWFRLIYDYSRLDPDRKLYYGLEDSSPKDVALESWYHRAVLDWVRDPLNPHAIAAIRPHTYTRGTLLLIIRCLLDYADAEFTCDTSEAIKRARILYNTALELLALPELNQRLGECTNIIARLPVNDTNPIFKSAVHQFESKLLLLGDEQQRIGTANKMNAALGSTGDPARRLARAEEVLAAALSNVPSPLTLAHVIHRAPERNASCHAALLRSPGLATTVALLSSELSPVVGTGIDTAVLRSSVVPIAFYSLNNKHGFCISPNPILKALRLRAELNLYKIQSCRNIAGMLRKVEFYSSSTDQTSGLPMIGVDGQLELPQINLLTPTPYRYSALIQRAKELVSHAQQLESLMLVALEKRDIEALTLLKARQDIQVAQATVQVQNLKIKEAEDRKGLAGLQQQRAEIEASHYQQLLDAGALDLEMEAIGWLRKAAVWYQVLGGAVSNVVQAAAVSAQAFSSIASAALSMAGWSSTWSQILQMRASLERTRQEWNLRVKLANQDQLIAAQQVLIEDDQKRIADQELAISELQTDNAEQLLDFHKNKFTSFELYDWMSDTLEQAYSFFLQQATAMAQLAARQLAFERQEGQPPRIKTDYWELSTDSFVSENTTHSGPDRRGLMGAERLLQDIFRLEQWGFDTNKRKLQLSKTFSLAQLAPIEFEQLRTTGVITFATPMQLLDYEYPGHYLRLIRRVSATVVALVPPSQGIHATLSSLGMSRVVIGPDVFQTITVRHPPESIALSSPLNATGVFTFETQPELASPFESLGIDTTWEFRMPRPGNMFDYNTLADILITIDYTALDSVDYRQQVIRQLERNFIGDRAFSLRREFSDAWWDLHNPDQIATPLTVSFKTTRADFPSNLDEVKISQLALVFVTDLPVPPEATPVRLKYTEEGTTVALGGSATPVDRLISTRRSNGGPWRSLQGKSPIGCWELAFIDSDETRAWLASGKLTDVLLVITYGAQTPPWPT